MGLTERNRHVKLSLHLILVIMIFFVLDPEMTAASGQEEFAAAKEGGHEYGFTYHSSQVLKGVVRPGDTLSKILRSYDVPFGKIHTVTQESRGVFDVRRMRAGDRYLTVKGPDSLSYPRYLIYEQTPVDFVVFKLEDPIDVHKGRKRVGVKVNTAEGVIETSVSHALSDHPFARDFTRKLPEIFAWSIDFYSLRRGDYFKVIFEEELAGGESLGLGKILATQFNHRGQDFYAFYFNQNGRGRYYDEEGKSLQKAFLKSPLKYARITSRFSNKRLHPLLKRYRKHLGIDYAAPAGTPIMTVGDGIILKTGYNKSKGKYVKVSHNGLYRSEYLHMSGFAKGIRPGVQVMQGDIIGYVGSTGLATGPHVEFRLHKNGYAVNPLKEDMPDGESLSKEYLESFWRQMADLRECLENIELGEACKPL
jgi:murein DD-endopeptidase MepM/ murein hydrolase activator NlpD